MHLLNEAVAMTTSAVDKPCKRFPAARRVVDQLGTIPLEDRTVYTAYGVCPLPLTTTGIKMYQFIIRSMNVPSTHFAVAGTP